MLTLLLGYDLEHLELLGMTNCFYLMPYLPLPQP